MALQVSSNVKTVSQRLSARGSGQSFWKNKLKPMNYLPPLWIFLSSGMIPVVNFFEKTWKTGNEPKGALWNASPIQWRDTLFATWFIAIVISSIVDLSRRTSFNMQTLLNWSKNRQIFVQILFSLNGASLLCISVWNYIEKSECKDIKGPSIAHITDTGPHSLVQASQINVIYFWHG